MYSIIWDNKIIVHDAFLTYGGSLTKQTIPVIRQSFVAMSNDVWIHILREIFYEIIGIGNSNSNETVEGQISDV